MVLIFNVSFFIHNYLFLDIFNSKSSLRYYCNPLKIRNFFIIDICSFNSSSTYAEKFNKLYFFGRRSFGVELESRGFESA